ncbi:MAG: hypothetical protein JWP91_2500 [Fibrobacteres bacterium]|nr:hypothetical protein [Fibrobacterota bacterium]
MNHARTLFAFSLAALLSGRTGWALETWNGAGFPDTARAEDLRSLRVDGDPIYRMGRNCVWTGVALLPISLLALVPVMDDGAFGITAADPGIGVAIGLAGMGLIHIGIPIMGAGVDNMEQNALRLKPGSEPVDTGLWSTYRQSWKWIGWGAAVTAASFPFLVAAALDWDNGMPALHYAAGGMAITGLGMGAIGVLEQEYSGYLFSRRHQQAKPALGRVRSLSLQPVLRVGRQGADGAGLKVVAGF